jgi:hypothetical protein
MPREMTPVVPAGYAAGPALTFRPRIRLVQAWILTKTRRGFSGTW